MNTTPTKTQESKPAFITSSDLVEMGLYPTVNAVWVAVSKKKIPSYKHGKKLLFKEHEIIECIEATRRATTEELESQAATYLLKKSVQGVR